MMPADEMWWKRVPAAEKLIETTCDELLDGKSIQVFSDMLWKETFLRLVLDEVRNYDAGIAFVEFNGDSLGAGMPLIESIAEQLGFGFNFDGKLKTLVGKLQANNGYIFQMRGLCARHLKEAHQLIKDMSKQNYRIALILEDDSPAQIKGVHQKKFTPTRMDVHYFAWTLLLDQGNIPLIEYAAILCEEISAGDPERCAGLCNQIHSLLQDAGAVCRWLGSDELQWRIHVAQLRGIQPVIEEQRLILIDSLGTRINRILPFDDEYQNHFTEPHEVELRHIIYHKGELSLSLSEQKLLDQLYTARNDLSHLRVLSQEQIKELALLSER